MRPSPTAKPFPLPERPAGCSVPTFSAWRNARSGAVGVGRQPEKRGAVPDGFPVRRTELAAQANRGGDAGGHAAFPGCAVDLLGHFTVDVAVEAGQHVDRPAREGETDEAGRGVGFRGGGHGAEGPAVEGHVLEGGVQQPVAGGFQRVFRDGFVWHVAALGSLPGCLLSADRGGAHGVLGKPQGRFRAGAGRSRSPFQKLLGCAISAVSMRLPAIRRFRQSDGSMRHAGRPAQACWKYVAVRQSSVDGI